VTAFSESANQGRAGAGSRWLDVAALSAYCVIVLLPLLWLGARFLSGVVHGVVAVAVSTRTLNLLLDSLLQAALVSVAVATIGTLAALRLWRWHAPLSRRLRWLPLAYLAVPGYVHALAWGRLDEVLGAAPHLPAAVTTWWVQVMSLLPIGVGLALVGLRTIDHRLIDAARQGGSDLSALRRVILPLASPHIVAAASLVFVIVLSDYTVASLFQSGVYALEIFAEFSASHDPLSAFATALPLLVTAAVVLTLVKPSIDRTATARGRGDYAWRLPPQWPTWLRWAQAAALAIVALQLAVPTVSLLGSVESITGARAALASASGDIIYTLKIAIVAAVASIPLGAALARTMLRGARWRLLAWIAVLLPLLFPPALVGIAQIETWQRLAPGLVYGSDLLPVFAYLARFTAVSALIILAQYSRLDSELIDAARVTQPSFTIRLLRVYVPLIGPGLAAAWLLFLALSLGELATNLLTVPPGRSTVAMRIYGYLHYGASESVAVLCLAIAATTVLVTLAALLAIRRRGTMAADTA